MSLTDYKKKRDFRRTPEPGPEAGKKHKQPIFVVQEHHASRLHYDFRGRKQNWLLIKGRDAFAQQATASGGRQPPDAPHSRRQKEASGG